jgi:hypothetical protein
MELCSGACGRACGWRISWAGSLSAPDAAVTVAGERGTERWSCMVDGGGRGAVVVYVTVQTELVSFGSGDPGNPA